MKTLIILLLLFFNSVQAQQIDHKITQKNIPRWFLYCKTSSHFEAMEDQATLKSEGYKTKIKESIKLVNSVNVRAYELWYVAVKALPNHSIFQDN